LRVRKTRHVLIAFQHQTTFHDYVTRSVTATVMTTPIARGPLVDWHRRNGATIAMCDGWEIAAHHASLDDARTNLLVDLSHRATMEINGPVTRPSLIELFG